MDSAAVCPLARNNEGENPSCNVLGERNVPRVCDHGHDAGAEKTLKQKPRCLYEIAGEPSALL